MPPHVVGHDSYSCRFLIFCLPGPVAGRGRGGWTGLDWTEIGGSGDEIFCYPVLFTTPPSPSFPTRSSSAMLLALLTTAALLGTSGAMHTEHADALDTPDVHRNAHFRHAHVNEVAGGGGVFFAGEADKHVEGVNFHSAEASRHNADKLKRTYMRFDRNTRIERPVDSLDELDPPSPPPLSRAAILARARRRGHHHHHGDGDGDGDDDGDGGEVHSNHAAHAHVPHSHAHHGNLAAVLGAAAPPPVLRPRQGKLLISDPSGSGSDSMVEIPQSRRFQEDIAAYRMEHRHHVKNSWGMAHDQVPHQVLEQTLARDQRHIRVPKTRGATGTLHSGGRIEVLANANPDTYVGADGIKRRHSETPLPAPRDPYRLAKDDARRFLPEYRHRRSRVTEERVQSCTTKGHTTSCRVIQPDLPMQYRPNPAG